MQHQQSKLVRAGQVPGNTFGDRSVYIRANTPVFLLKTHFYFRRKAPCGFVLCLDFFDEDMSSELLGCVIFLVKIHAHFFHFDFLHMTKTFFVGPIETLQHTRRGSRATAITTMSRHGSPCKPRQGATTSGCPCAAGRVSRSHVLRSTVNKKYKMYSIHYSILCIHERCYIEDSDSMFSKCRFHLPRFSDREPSASRETTSAASGGAAKRIARR